MTAAVWKNGGLGMLGAPFERPSRAWGRELSEDSEQEPATRGPKKEPQ